MTMLIEHAQIIFPVPHFDKARLRMSAVLIRAAAHTRCHTYSQLLSVHLSEAAETKGYHVLQNSSQYFSFPCFLISWILPFFPLTAKMFWALQTLVWLPGHWHHTQRDLSNLQCQQDSFQKVHSYFYFRHFQKWSCVSGEVLISLFAQRTPGL